MYVRRRKEVQHCLEGRGIVLVIVLEHSADGLKGDLERVPLLVLGCRLHDCHNREYELGLRSLKPKSFHLGVLRLQHLDVGAYLLAKIELLLHYFDEFVEDARRGQAVCCSNHLGDNLVQLLRVNLLLAVICFL